jgi:N-acetylglucosaminyl-diphospho-decaprenol L-rhamnosyltransferase
VGLMSESPATASCTVDVSVIIVNWNVSLLLERCLASILRDAHPRSPGIWQLPSSGHGFEVLVVDSASSDGSPEMVRALYPGVRLYASTVNLGYTGGNNLGIRESRGRYLLLLNPDTEITGHAMEQMASFLERTPRVGVVGPQLRYADGSVQPSRRRLPTLRTAFVDSTFLEKWFPNHPELRRYKVLDLPPDEGGLVDWLVGACLLVRREVVDEVGYLDEGYFMYSEELDWQKRIRDAGWEIAYLAAAQVIHYEGKSSEQAGAATHIRFSHSKIRYFRKHHGPHAAKLVRWWLVLNYVYEWSVEALKWALGHRRDLRRARVKTYAEVLRSLAASHEGRRTK